MKRKLLTGLAPLLVIAAFAALPIAAQATSPHYYVNSAKLKENGKTSQKTSTAWGTITLKGTKGGAPGNKITCHNVAAGTLENPVGGGSGEGSTQVFATFDCEQELVCPAEATGVRVTSSKTPWHNVLTEEVAGTIRQETTGVRVLIECFHEETKIAEIPFVIGATEKGQRPNEKAGSSALHPGFLEFGEGSGELEVEGSAGTITGKTEGTVKALGYNAQELIGVANP